MSNWDFVEQNEVMKGSSEMVREQFRLERANGAEEVSSNERGEQPGYNLNKIDSNL